MKIRSSLHVIFYNSVLCLLSVGMGGCEEVVTDFITVSTPAVPVADAWVTNQLGETYVKLSYSDDFGNTNQIPPITNAIITLVDENGGFNRFEAATPGHYRPINSQFAAQPNQDYTLSVRIDNEVWQATASMPTPPTITSIRLIERRDLPSFEDGFYIEISLFDAPTTRNFYLWQLWEGEQRLFPQQIFLSDDRGLNGQTLIFAFPEPIEFPEAPLKVRSYAISEDAYEYYRGIQQLISNNGLSRTIPENPPSNFPNGLLGFFTLTAFTETTLTPTPQSD